MKNVYLKIQNRKTMTLTFKKITTLLLLIFIGQFVFAQENKIKVSPQFIITNQPVDLTMTLPESNSKIEYTVRNLYQLHQGEKLPIEKVYKDNKQPITISNVIFHKSGRHKIILESEHATYHVEIRSIPHYLSILPPILAIVLALVFRQVLIALFAGIWLGAFFLEGFSPHLSLLRVLDVYMINALNDPDHLRIIIFSMTLGGMVGILTRSGATNSLMQKLSKWANHRGRGQIATMLMGFLIFFDDYANTLIVGNTMRPVTDRLRISREKLSYIVDATAAPVVSIAIFSTWIGFELGLIQNSFNQLGIEQNVYMIYLQTIPYRFYCVLTLIFVFLIGFLQRDFGPMLKAESRAFQTGDVLAKNSIPLADLTETEVHEEGQKLAPWWHPFITIGAVIFLTLIALYYTGRGNSLAAGNLNPTLQDIIGQADPFKSLLWSSVGGSFVAAFLALCIKSLSLKDIISSWIAGTKSMIYAMIVLTLAWTISNICESLQTAEFVIGSTKGILSPSLLPALTFLIAAFISFATGTSWGTMAILIPIVLPLSWEFITGGSEEPVLMIATLAAVLSGAVFGDHCSPISDTTIMSSMASGSDHIDHVKTQISYAAVVGGVALFIGYLPAGIGISSWISNFLSIGILLFIILLLGKKVEHI